MERRELLTFAGAAAASFSLPRLAKAQEGHLTHAEALKNFEALKRAHIKSQSGQPFRLADFAGKGLLINFWANWCPNCISEFQSMHFVREGVRPIAPFDVLLVSKQTDWNKDQAFAAQHQLDFPLYEFTWDNDNPREHSDYMAVSCSTVFHGRMIDPMPTTYVIDKNGELVIIVRGSLDWSKKEYMPMILRTFHPENNFRGFSD